MSALKSYTIYFVIHSLHTHTQNSDDGEEKDNKITMMMRLIGQNKSDSHAYEILRYGCVRAAKIA